MKPGVFCSRKCANSRTWSEADREKKSQAAQLSSRVRGRPSPNKGKLTAERETKPCAVCGTTFTRKKSRPSKYCSTLCRLGDSGGARQGSGRSLPGWYKGIYCGSTYELAWVIYQLDHNVQFTRFPGEIRTEYVCYVPDFLMGNCIIEIKGYVRDERTQALKEQASIEAGYEYRILYKKDLAACFAWTKAHYNKPLHLLYDNSTKYVTTACGCCKLPFQHVIGQVRLYCSRRCAGLERAAGRATLAAQRAQESKAVVC